MEKTSMLFVFPFVKNDQPLKFSGIKYCYICIIMKRSILYLLAISTTIFSSCKKDKKSNPEPTTPVVSTGGLSGKIYFYDQYDSLYTRHLGTASVSVVGQNFSTLSDTSGRFTLTGLSAGIYTLSFQKQGCGTVKLQDVHFQLNDTTQYRASMADIPSFNLTNVYAKDTTWFSSTFHGIFYSASPNPLHKKASIIAIVGKSANLDLSNPRSYLNYPVTSFADSLDYNRFFSYSLLKDTYGFKKDSTLYLKVYPVSSRGSSYLDNGSGSLIYTAYGAPYGTVFSFVIP